MTTSRKKSSGSSTGTDALLAEIFRSPEYLAALKDRLIRGEAKAQEIAVARSLGLLIPRQDEDTEARENLRRVPLATRRLMSDIDRMALSAESTRLVIIRDPSGVVGVGIGPRVPDAVPAPVPAPEPTDESLLP